MSAFKCSTTAAATTASEGRAHSHTVTATAPEDVVVDVRDVGAGDDGGAVGQGLEGRGGGEYADTEAISTVVAVADAVADAVSDAAPPQAAQVHNSQKETSKVKNGQEVDPQRNQQEQSRSPTAAAVGLSDVDIGRGVREAGEGGEAERKAESYAAGTGCDSEFHGHGRRRGTADAAVAATAAAAAVDVTVGGASGHSVSSLSLSSSSSSSPPLLAQDVAALECVAWRSLRDLHAMCASSARYPASASAPAVVVPGCSQSSGPRSPSSCSNRSDATGAAGNTSSNANAPNRLRLQVRTRGVLESLVAICAPFPWTPVDPPLGAVSAVEEGRTRQGCVVSDAAVGATSSTNPASADAAPPGDTMQIAGNTSVDMASAAAAAASASVTSGGCHSKAQRRGPQNCEHDHHHHHHHHHRGVSHAAAATIPRACNQRGAEEKGRNGRAKQEGARSRGDCGSGGREAMTESALAVLLTVLADEPRNRDYVLKMDGGAPLVSWWRL